ncbi:hypothetical protein A3D66_00330 [Candidatus Kaiserbacteria bacterium RIFCSPHIGHO2_02_FULL_50_9]|uniref:Fimbrial assembly protein n=1 Tax=Candidatus Kaiserbacteria bacterium RIFCSPLOWO2_01_FULL_51_21 TaxID=1798508 RepID=A0A1F6EDE5_9BACT|nr:MAG: hypothetical protein A2761_02370 [Candidatus Kaiserbacteria bacterium RIFCSPHIGHO2_01_FULL_51_33]OGG63147.1 MAG: hypothetical protein A3D66_00330 [Candidatus Kaiserbacteria bacterium RIFCSPHIGHO2_02_FULL_50_9]OGG71630.1 MAG: hypothetical protein A3A35_00460 [Candidatus Kaiserbacteria bacterium RIFCSPLOWO2_01_FULL_51_21]
MNLLPPQEQRILRREYFLRLATVGFILADVAILIGAAALVPSLSLSLVKKKALENNALILKQALEAGKKNNALVLLTEAKQRLDALFDNRDNLTLEGGLSKVTAARSPGMQLTEFVFDRSAKVPVVRIRGIAPRRADLAAFAKKLGEEKEFTSVSFPVSDFTANENLEFSLTITGSF